MCRVSRFRSAWLLAIIVGAPLAGARAQTTRIYAQRVDTLYREWQRVHACPRG